MPAPCPRTRLGPAPMGSSTWVHMTGQTCPGTMRPEHLQPSSPASRRLPTLSPHPPPPRPLPNLATPAPSHHPPAFRPLSLWRPGWINCPLLATSACPRDLLGWGCQLPALCQGSQMTLPSSCWQEQSLDSSEKAKAFVRTEATIPASRCLLDKPWSLR